MCNIQYRERERERERERPVGAEPEQVKVSPYHPPVSPTNYPAIVPHLGQRKTARGHGGETRKEPLEEMKLPGGLCRPAASFSSLSQAVPIYIYIYIYIYIL